jgi:CheY-like chemotaxis protein
VVDDRGPMEGPRTEPGQSEEETSKDHLANVKLCKTNRHLVVDDAKTNRTLLKLHLEAKSASIVVHEAENAVEALQKVAEVGSDGYDVIWTDFDMPGMNGLELSRKLRGVGFAKYLVIASGNMSLENQTACLQAGVDLVRLKPLRRKSLYGLAIMQLFE